MSGYTTFLRTKWENFNGTTAASSPCQLRHEAGNTCLGERQERKQNGDTSHRYVESHPTRATKSVPRCLRAPRDGVGRHLASLSLSPLPLLALLETKARGSRRQNGLNGRTETTKEGDAVTRLTRISILSLTCAPHRGERATLSLDEGSERGRSPRVWPPVRSDNARASITLLLRTMARAQDRCSQLHEIAVCSCSSPSSLPRVSSSFDLPSHGEGGRRHTKRTGAVDAKDRFRRACRAMLPQRYAATRGGGHSIRTMARHKRERERTKGVSARCSLRSFSKSRRGTVTHCPRSQRSPLKRNDCVICVLQNAPSKRLASGTKSNYTGRLHART